MTLFGKSIATVRCWFSTQMPLELVYRTQAELPVNELVDSVFIGKKTDLTWENVRLYLTSEIDEVSLRGLLEKTAPGETSQYWAAKGSHF